MTRPPLTPHISSADFQQFYWLKQELVAFCREQKLPTTGSKQQLTERINHYLNPSLPAPAIPPAGSIPLTPMPTHFTRQSIIGPGWRCSQALRAFFEQELGPQFHFNGVMRDFIKNSPGRTLEEAIQAWEIDQQNPTPKEIASQFEYNQFFRTYFQNHPQASRAEAISAWQKHKNQRKEPQ